MQDHTWVQPCGESLAYVTDVTAGWAMRDYSQPQIAGSHPAGCQCCHIGVSPNQSTQFHLHAPMHEMGIANSILDAVRNEAARYPSCRPVKVGVRLGELAAIDPDSLRFCFEALVADSDLDGLVLEIEQTRRRHHCHQCGTDFMVTHFNFECPACHAISRDCIAGDELELSYVEVEEHEPVALGTQNS